MTYDISFVGMPGVFQVMAKSHSGINLYIYADFFSVSGGKVERTLQGISADIDMSADHLRCTKKFEKEVAVRLCPNRDFGPSEYRRNR